jgi:hypothetical protein
MAHIFISYSSKDVQVANAVCAALEAATLRCWMAPRDIRPGQDWGAAIIEAIEGCQCVVLVFSANSNASADVHQEVVVAFEEGKAIIPLRIDAARVHSTLRYRLSAVQWLDAQTLPLDTLLAELVAAAAAHVSSEVQAGLAQLGTIGVTVSNSMDTTDGFTVSLDGHMLRTVRGTSLYHIGYVPSGQHEVSVTGTIGERRLEASELVNVQPGSTVRVTLALPAEEPQR